MMMTTEIKDAKLADLVKQVQAGNEVLLTQNNLPVAKLVSAAEKPSDPRRKLSIRSFTGHQALTPAISQSDLAEEMFSR